MLSGHNEQPEEPRDVYLEYYSGARENYLHIEDGHSFDLTSKTGHKAQSERNAKLGKNWLDRNSLREKGGVSL
jgi:hypothetical protein